MFAVLLLCVILDSGAVRLQPLQGFKNDPAWWTPEKPKMLAEVAKWFSKETKPDWNQKFDTIAVTELQADLRKSGLSSTAALLQSRSTPRAPTYASSQEVPTAASASNPTATTSGNADGPYIPVVQMHGMGDFSVSPGMVEIRRAISKLLNGTYVKSAKVGATLGADSRNTFFTTMNAQIEFFAKEVKADPELKNGFNAVGFSQGNLVIRGYIERHNDPPVLNFISMHGVMLGVAGFPQCNLSSYICKTLDQSLGKLAYTSSVQHHLAQANYFRDPMRIPEYLEGNLFLPDLNNEGEIQNHAYTERFTQLNKLVLVKALGDTEVVPNESEWFGFYEDGNLDSILTMNETVWYKEDRFGLKTLDEAGKIDLYSTPGNHLEFSLDYLLDLVSKYFRTNKVAEVQ